LGILAAESIAIICAGLLTLLAQIAQSKIGSDISLISVATVAWITTRLALRYATMVTFFSGYIKGFMVTMWRRAAFSQLLNSKTITLDEQRGDIQNPFRPRAFQITRLNHRATNTSIAFLHVHTNAIGPSHFRAAQVREVVGADRGQNDMVVLLGDFNDKEDSECVRAADDYGFVDAFRTHGDGHGHTWVRANSKTVGYMRAADFRCDFIFYHSPGPTILSNATCGVVLDKSPTSDHYGVMFSFTPRVEQRL
jgi:endonuclease/exonuclease/phosphatase (EEP) superfamily protein YafD